MEPPELPELPGPPRRRRDRHGRGLRGPLAPAGSAPARSRAARFALEAAAAMDRVQARYPEELAGIRVVVAAVPPDDPADRETPVPLARVVRGGGGAPARIVIHRRPVELRTDGLLDQRRLLREVVAEAVGELLGKEPEEVDPTYGRPED